MSFFSTKNIKGFMSSAGIDLNPQVLATQFLDNKHVQQTLLGINVPLIGSIGTTLQESGLLRFGKFSDPRAALRAQRENKAWVPDDFGDSAYKPVPAGRRGEVPKATAAYENVKKACIESRTPWCDLDFPADNSSLFYDPREARSGIKWLRPSELVQNPQFIVDGASRFDVQQGELGDCWLLAAVACLSMHDDLMQQVVPMNQNFSQDYCGAFYFRFWHFGEWREVVVDDRLPTIDGRLIYLRSETKNEFWSALMEKAYAKLCGCYQSLKGGTTSEALEDFTGGIPEMFDLRSKTPPNLLEMMLKANAKRSLMACSIQAGDSASMEAKLPNGLVVGHAYSITSVAVNVEVQGKRLPLVRIRNPWGNYVEWRGAWSDNSKEWQSLSEEQRKELGLVFDNDGEFWMSYSDFCREFEKLEICHLGAQSLNSPEEEKNEQGHHDHDHGQCVWEENIQHGEWRAHVNAGGCRNYLDTFWTNPQFKISLNDPDDDDGERKGTLIIGLMQKDRRALRKLGKDLLTIGYAIYEVPPNHEGTLTNEFYRMNRSVARSPNFINLREVTGRHRLPCGNYVVVPSTFQPNEEADFMLRVFSEKPHTHEELDEKTSIVTPKPDIVPSGITDDQVKKLHAAFSKVAGPDNEIDAESLLDIINAAFSKDFSFGGFSLETSRSLVAMMDVDRSGHLNFDEFRALWELLRLWKTAFKQYDADKNGSMNAYELRNALKSVGFNINNATFTSLAMRFSRRNGFIGFDDYVMCCARLRTVFEMFAAIKGADGKINIDESMFVNSVLYI